MSTYTSHDAVASNRTFRWRFTEAGEDPTWHYEYCEGDCHDSTAGLGNAYVIEKFDTLSYDWMPYKIVPAKEASDNVAILYRDGRSDNAYPREVVSVHRSLEGAMAAAEAKYKGTLLWHPFGGTGLIASGVLYDYEIEVTEVVE